MSAIRAIIVSFVVLAPYLFAKQQPALHDSLADYIARMRPAETNVLHPTAGSLWRDDGRLANMAADYKAVNAGDLITIVVMQDVQASNAGDVSANRSFSANAGIDAIAGHVSTSGVRNIFSGNSAEKLQGKAQADTKSSLRTTLAGTVAAVLPNGVLVIEAERQLLMNNERQTVVLRGLVRPGDVSPGNVVLSNAIGNLELELKGKGVISDSTRRPNIFTRLLLRVIGF